MYINKAFILGNLTRDPEVKALPSGIKVCSFSLATNRTWKDANGQRQEASEYHTLVAFGKQAELIGQYVRKGGSLYVEGRLQTRSWEKDGEKRYRTEIVVENFQFGPRATGAGERPAGDSFAAPATKEEQKFSPASDIESIDYPDEAINSEDIPF
jgi:single-strand DNA-binding protein